MRYGFKYLFKTSSQNCFEVGSATHVSAKIGRNAFRFKVKKTADRQDIQNNVKHIFLNFFNPCDAD